MNFNERTDSDLNRKLARLSEDEEQADYVREWLRQHPAHPETERERIAWVTAGVVVVMVLAVWFTWAWAAGW